MLLSLRMDWSRMRSSLVLMACLLWLALQGTVAEQLVQVLHGHVGAENYTYYRLLRPGLLRLTLNSVRGDCDIYVSDTIERPSYEEYELQSVTCGVDEVEIPAHLSRPVGISVYGYPSHDVSEYTLSIVHIADADSDYAYFMQEDDQGAPRPSNTRPPHLKALEDEESVLWSIFVNILKIIVDILL